MNALFAIIVVIAIVLIFVGGFVQAFQFLLWVGIILAVLVVIAWLFRALTGSKR